MGWSSLADALLAVVTEDLAESWQGVGRRVPRRVGDVQIRALPGLVRGWIETNCDAAGRVYYRAVAKDSAEGRADARPSAGDPRRRGSLDHYLADARDDLKQVTEVGEAGEIGAIPLPVSMGA